MNKRIITAMSALCTMAAFLFTCTFIACGDDDDDDDDSNASTYEEEEEGSINGYDYVDLGLSVVWATCNVGASSPEDYGDYYAWGETSTKSSYTEDNSETYGKDIDDISGTYRDVAYFEWGSPWRMPTYEEFDELIASCDCEWTTLNGVEGGMFTSKKNGNSIFLPAADRWDEENMPDVGTQCRYWSSTPVPADDAHPEGEFAYSLYVSTDDLEGYDLDMDEDGRYEGHSIRAVSEL